MQLEPRTVAHLLLTASRNVAARRALAAPSTHRDNNALHKAADAHYRQMLLTVQAAFLRGRKAYKSSGTDAAVKAIRASLKATLSAVLVKAYVGGANAGVKRLRTAALRTLAPVKFDLSFNVSNQNAIDWANEHAAELADGISETSRERIQNAIADAVAGGGIDENYDDILDAVGSEARADVIARTEVMTAANEGNRASWDDAVEAGLLPEDSRVVWIATSDACPECEDLDGEERTLDGEYPDDGGDGPPLHPNCRCTEGIVG